jgi:tRNA(fMet)-specific endonuclease VapC
VPRYLLDTNTCIAVMRNHPKAVRHIAAVPPAECAVSTITEYELFTGVEKCANPVKERAKVNLLLSVVQLSPFDSGAAKEAARVRAILESKAN